MLLPSLIGHLLYGAVSASIFLAFERRVANQLSRAATQPADPAAHDEPCPCVVPVCHRSWHLATYAVGLIARTTLVLKMCQPEEHGA
jgi:hypothetical protein